MARTEDGREAFFYKWYPELYEADTLHLTPEQDGIYRRLIDWIMVKGRPLPDNDLALAGAARVSEEVWSRHRDVLRPFFTPINGALHQRRAMQGLKTMADRGFDRRLAARAGAARRWGTQASEVIVTSDNHGTTAEPRQDHGGSAGVPWSMPNHARSRSRNIGSSSSTVESSPEPGENPLSRPADAATRKPKGPPQEVIDRAFEEFWVAYPSRGRLLSNPKRPAKAKFELLVRSGVDPARIIAGATVYAGTRAGEDARYTKQAVTFLNQREFDQWADQLASDGNQRPSWNSILTVARDRKSWHQSWGPMPGQEGCEVPTEMLLPGDGLDWTIYDPGS